MKQKKQIFLFNIPSVFDAYENQAIDGQLDYEFFPPEEYRYFSKLSRLGYHNRHHGWTKGICEIKQEEYRREYRKACAERDERLEHMKRLQTDLIRITELNRQLNTAKTADKALTVALHLIEKLTNEPGLKQRIEKNLQENKA